MRPRVTAAVLLLAMLVSDGCQRTRTEATQIADPPEAFSPHETLELDQTRSWGGFEIEVEKVFARGGGWDIDLDVEVAYTNLGPEAMSPPTEVRFELDGRVYPANAGKLDYRIPSGARSEETISGTLADVVGEGRSLRDGMREIVEKASMVYGTGPGEVVFPFAGG